jgi:hypothetical protein
MGGKHSSWKKKFSPEKTHNKRFSSTGAASSRLSPSKLAWYVVHSFPFLW